MQVLEEQGEQTAGHVVAHMGIAQATATALLKKLESIGMIYRRRDENGELIVLDVRLGCGQFDRLERTRRSALFLKGV